MKALRLLLAGAQELLSLLVDDVLTFVGAVVGLTGTYLLAHHLSDAWAGYLMYAVVWVFLAISLTRAARR
ncbi:MAG: hypothetical protein JWM40_290 [Frankiales bacterium]|nr:hypothetical protein [Frankiales bacterium]